jgi:hypothetical protein
MIAMPFTGKEQEDVSSLDLCFRKMGRAEHSFAFRLVEKLVFIEGSSLLEIEVISIGMTLGRIFFSRGDFFPSHGADGETPFGVSFCC